MTRDKSEVRNVTLYSLSRLTYNNITTLHNEVKFVQPSLVMVIWQLDLQVPVQSVPITTNVVSWNLAHEMYLLQHYVIKFASY